MFPFSARLALFMSSEQEFLPDNTTDKLQPNAQPRQQPCVTEESGTRADDLYSKNAVML